MIIWLNGAFGAGKTTTAKELASLMPHARICDPEIVGYMLMEYLKDRDVHDFQDVPPWRSLVPVVLSEIAGLTGQDLIAPQTVMNEGYWNELRRGFERHSLEVYHVVLHVDTGPLNERINADDVERRARAWRTDHACDYATARVWMTSAADLTVDLTTMSAAEGANAILQALKPAGAGAS
jgi:chloramphenicol 3-O-phosphotransferase